MGTRIAIVRGADALFELVHEVQPAPPRTASHVCTLAVSWPRRGASSPR